MGDKHLDKIKQLIDVGEDATQGEWYEYGEPEVNIPWTVFNNGRPVWDFFENQKFITQAANARDSIKWAYEQLTLPEPLIMVDNVPIKISEYQGLIKSHEQELEHLQKSIVKIREDNARLRKALELLVDDVQDYEAWQRPCHALDIAKQALGGEDE